MRPSFFSLFLVLCASLLLVGCGDMSSVSHERRVPIAKEQVIGQWEADLPSDSLEVGGIAVMNFHPGGTGIILRGNIWTNPGNGPAYYIYYNYITWEQTAADTITIDAQPRVKVIGDRTYGYVDKIRGVTKIYSTPFGLMVDGLHLHGSYFKKAAVVSADPKQNILARTERYYEQALQSGRVLSPSQSMARNRAENQALLGALSSVSQSTSMGGTGSYAPTGSNYAAQQAVATATQEVMVAALTDSPEEAQAARQSFQTGYAIGSGNTQAVTQNLAGGVGQGGAAQAEGSSAAQSGAAAQMAEAIASGKDFVTTVAVQDARQYGYSDGYAYNIQAVLPNPGYHNAGGSRSAGEFCIFYGLPLDQARSLLATGFALSGDRSAYGPGNPQQTVSWERVPVRNGSSVKMGVQWQTGTMPAAPRFANRYMNSKP